MSALTHDRWLIPARQCELPGRDLVPSTVLHARREWTFLILATLFLVATVTLPLFLGGTVVDLGELFGLEQSFELSIGIMIFPVALVAAQLVCELYGARRADALAFVGALASVAIAGIAIAADDATPLVPVAALVTYSAVAHATNALVFGGARRALHGHHLWLRSVLAIAIAQIVGWAAYLLVIYVATADVAAATNLVAAAALFTCAVALVAMVPLSLARRVLALYLRVGRIDEHAIDHAAMLPEPPRRRLPPAMIIEDEPAPLPAYNVTIERPYRAALHPFTTGEMEFFREGEELANAES